MDDKIFQEKFDRAWKLKKERKFEESMKLYSELYEQLIKDAFEATGGVSESEQADEIKVNKYLRGDKIACTILNNMGVISAENGNREGAKRYFELSRNLTPKDLDYQNPIIGLRELE